MSPDDRITLVQQILSSEMSAQDKDICLQQLYHETPDEVLEEQDYYYDEEEPEDGIGKAGEERPAFLKPKQWKTEPCDYRGYCFIGDERLPPFMRFFRTVPYSSPDNEADYPTSVTAGN